jgi:hypothetical protein
MTGEITVEGILHFIKRSRDVPWMRTPKAAPITDPAALANPNGTPIPKAMSNDQAMSLARVW